MKQVAKERQQKGEDKVQKKRNKRLQETNQKFWNRWRKRAAYMEELGEEEGNLLYKAEQAKKMQKQRGEAKRKKQGKKKKKQKKSS